MKILVLGSEGFVGTNLVNGLKKTHDIFTADLVDKNSCENYVKFDITDPDNVKSVVKNVDVVIDLVADSLVSSIDGSIKNAQVNIIGLLNVLEACRKNEIKKIIFTSASSLIGQPQRTKVSEAHIPKPKTAYGITKLASEHYLRLYNELYGINFVIFRFFNIYGPYQKNGLIPSLYNRIVKNEPLVVFGKGNQVRDYVFINDVIPFFEKSVSTKIADNLTLNIGTGKGTSIIQIIEILSKILQKNLNISYKPERLGEIGDFVADTSFLESVFGLTPQTDIYNGLQKTIYWLQH